MDAVIIRLKGRDAFTVNQIRSRMFIEARDVLQFLQGYESISEIRMYWSLPLVDSFGNTHDVNVMRIIFEKQTLDRINFDNFNWNNIPVIADDYFEHAVFSS